MMSNTKVYLINFWQSTLLWNSSGLMFLEHFMRRSMSTLTPPLSKTSTASMLGEKTSNWFKEGVKSWRVSEWCNILTLFFKVLSSTGLKFEKYRPFLSKKPVCERIVLLIYLKTRFEKLMAANTSKTCRSLAW